MDALPGLGESEVGALIESFMAVCDLAGVTIPPGAVAVEMLPAPHRSPSVLPAGKMAVYIFQWGSQCLKIGKVGPKSQARYTSHHYSPGSSNSNLARCILKECTSLGISGLSTDNVGAWIKENTDRINILLDDRLGIAVLSMLEAFLHCRLKPRFEGFGSQK